MFVGLPALTFWSAEPEWPLNEIQVSYLGEILNYDVFFFNFNII